MDVREGGAWHGRRRYSRGLGPTAGFLTGWMMVFGYALYVPAGIALTSAYASLLLAGTLHVIISARGARFAPFSWCSVGVAIDRHDVDPERQQRYRDDLEVSDAERDTDDRQAEQDARDQMSERELPAEEDYP
jgi:hypothetical protein